MVQKRNVKIDTSEQFEVLNLESIDMNHVEEYSLPHIDSGMEAEEEKELHLKHIISSGQGEIPIPIIEKVENPAMKYYKKIDIPAKYIVWEKDVPNEYNITKEDEIHMKALGVDRVSYKSAVKSIESGHISGELAITLKSKVANNILLREESKENPSYVCFRKRAVKPNKKMRRSEAQIYDKLNRLHSELYVLQKLGDLSVEKVELEKEMIFLNNKITEKASKILDRNKKSIKKKVVSILKTNKKDKKLSEKEREDFFKGIMFDRNKIRLLRKRLHNTINSFDIDVKKEAKALINYMKEKSIGF